MRERQDREKNGEIHGVDCGSDTRLCSGGAGSDGEEVHSRGEQVLESKHQLYHLGSGKAFLPRRLALYALSLSQPLLFLYIVYTLGSVYIRSDSETLNLVMFSKKFQIFY